MLTAPNFRASRNARGYVLLEVLVSMVILAIGLLGVAKLQASTRQLETESYQRAQAVILLQDMVARMTANRKSASCYVITADAGGPTFGHGGSAPANCASGAGNIEQQNRAVADMAEWNQLLLGAAETINGDNAGAMIGARGCVQFDAASNLYVVTVTWQGLFATSSPAGLTCGIGTYGDDAQRRAVSAVVRIPDLG